MPSAINATEVRRSCLCEGHYDMQLSGMAVVSYRDVWEGNEPNLRSEKSGNKAICADNPEIQFTGIRVIGLVLYISFRLLRRKTFS